MFGILKKIFFFSNKICEIKEEQDTSAIPKTYEEAVDYVYDRIGENTVETPGFHFSAGMKMRNDLGLWESDSPLHKDIKNRFGLWHADDMGAIISEAANARKNGREYDPHQRAEEFHQYWANMQNYSVTIVE